jgi:hypothetical protein
VSRRALVGFAVAVAASSCLACTKPSDDANAKRMPKPPPPPSGEVVSALVIDVDVDGKPAPRIDAALLARTKPDFEAGEKRAWKLAALLGPAAERPGATISVTGEGGVIVTMPTPKTPTDPVPVLVVTRRGETVGALVKPSDPFPAYHGQGGMLHRPGDPLPRIVNVTKVTLFVIEPDHPPTQHLSVRVQIAGKPDAVWTMEAFAKVPHWGDGGMRDAWSLRDVAKTLVGPKARVTAVAGGGKRKAIEKAEWDDAKRTPLLRPNREEQLKFRWIEKDGALGEAEVKQVDALEITVDP